MPSISVVVPVFNKESRIQCCLESVVRQRCAPDEIIVIDDGSTDGSLKVIQSVLAETSAPIKLIEQENAGVSVARNVGSGEAHSDYIAFLDADDEWSEDFIAAAKALIRDYPHANLYSFAHTVQNESLGEYFPPCSLDSNFRGYVSDYFLEAVRGPLVKSSKVVVRKSAFLRLGGFPPGVRVGEDLFLWAEFARTGKIAYENRCLTTVHQESDTSRVLRKGEVSYLVEHYAENLSKLSQVPGIRAYLWRVAFMHIFGCLIQHDRSTGVKTANVARRIFPVAGWALLLQAYLPREFVLLLRRLRRREKTK